MYIYLYLYLYLSIYLSLYLSISLSIYLSIYKYLDQMAPLYSSTIPILGGSSQCLDVIPWVIPLVFHSGLKFQSAHTSAILGYVPPP